MEIRACRSHAAYARAVVTILRSGESTVPLMGYWAILLGVYHIRVQVSV